MDAGAQDVGLRSPKYQSNFHAKHRTLCGDSGRILIQKIQGMKFLRPFERGDFN